MHVFSNGSEEFEDAAEAATKTLLSPTAGRELAEGRHYALPHRIAIGIPSFHLV